VSELESAWLTRDRLGLFEKTEALRIFHGPGEGLKDFEFFAIDRFQNNYWVTQWESADKGQLALGPAQINSIKNRIVDFLRSKKAESVVAMIRPAKGLPFEPVIWHGKPPMDRFQVQEYSMRFWIQLQKTRHPGLFLDHAPLRNWLVQNAQDLRVLNTFAYTGSLSVAAALGKASFVTTLDLSKPSVEWANDNFKLNKISEARHRAIAGDVFEWLPRLKREKQLFDCVILDPPSFSHGKKQKFSTSKDLEKLHFMAMELLSPNGYLITSINSANVSLKKFEMDVSAAAQSGKLSFKILKQIDLPETFPTRLGTSQERYLKGWILQSVN
jgi:23S rRNA (cytosine1962-C5)-methyltransferase